ncbi:MAG TPA: Asp-tRNA(Asn)/Glu-tRNA(Gln) amidotransferase subunit GatB [Deltaproteobacteria bacterium]|nr:Asp-tRNA(Asn)/Glu-tRNA(Gln) amidotransferase subunit GatB [Deltaproteobacteria bacterium]HPR53678.1 Asp-tRNA(Asn)/Glu-tRNA(Gln) amidotransferase subunit GatB [Deltaproteobacteria bacterium]HXK47194.1 Asp-tRNA(Asn)/Glu-tRNA(Gln) amidotransferase subunit GatB [Deltaproteobacteria bacterium]
MSAYEAVIGLEVHAQLLTDSKIFCGCSTAFGGEPNTNTCPVCLGMPGVLPVLNRKVVDFGIRLGLALDCSIERRNIFARKNYFYPDLPKGYQITQFENPLCSGGHLDISVQGAEKRIGIRRIHMEEDAGKNVHDESRPRSYIDFNRSGVPLLEIVTEPDLTSSEEAVAYLRELRLILMHLGVSDGNMEEGSFRCDANISVRPRGSGDFGTRTELKNMNSFRNVQRALDYEIRRHVSIRESGALVVQETLLWDASEGRTLSMRSKEESHDYRYFPEPDLVPVAIEESWIERIRKSMPELPAARRDRFVRQYGLPPYDADQLTQTPAMADYYEQCVSLLDAPKDISNWIMSELTRVMNEQGTDIRGVGITPAMLVGLVSMVKSSRISGLTAKEVITKMASGGKTAEEIVRDLGAEQVSDEDELRGVVSGIIEANPKESAQYRAGKTQLLGFFVGEVMKASRGRANPKVAGNIVREMLKQ